MENVNFREYMTQANALMGEGKYEAAVKFFEKAEAEDRMNVDVYLSKGVALANLGEYEKAKQTFEKALKIEKKNGLVYFHLGNIEILLGNKAKGIELYNNAISYGFDDAQVYFSLGLMFEEEGDDNLAIRNYAKALIKDPNRADIRIRKIRLFIKNRQMQEALQALDELILANSDTFEGYHLKFLTLVNLQRYDEAAEVVDFAMKLFPKDTAFALDKASLMITKKEFNEALAYMKFIEENYEVDTEIRHNLAMERARVFSLMEDMDRTIASLEAARQASLAYEPPVLDLEALFLLSSCYMNVENYEKAIWCSQELKKAEGENYYALAAYYYEPLALKKLGKTEEAEKLFREAIEYFRKVTLDNPGNLDAYSFRIMALHEVGEFEKALEIADYLVLVRDEIAETHTLRGIILTDLGREEEAAAERAKAVSLGGPLSTLPANNQ